ncbi:MAG: hypothetical protein RJA36_3204 [Pseudomonadota bacterium]|jgi:redox-sensitive bicupin YhaK (pirin superfamily)
MTDIQRIAARHMALGEGMVVRRLLPARERRMIGAWCFLDHAGPASFEPGRGMKVGPHPHAGLQTFTWMIEGEVLHRDSLGHEQVVRPGQVNLMTAGHGIAHSEESLPTATRLHAAQLWIALPAGSSHCLPAFEHYPELPMWQEQGCRLILLAGHWGSRSAPARLYSDLVGMELLAQQDTTLSLPLNPGHEYGLLPLEGKAGIGPDALAADELAYLSPGRQQLALALAAGSRALLLGGTPFGEDIVMWWNFVGSSRAEVTRARQDWEAGHERFGAVHGHEGASLVAPPLPWKA